LAAQLENDARLREHVKWRLGPVLTELKRKFKRFMKPVQVSFPFILSFEVFGSLLPQS